MASSRFVSYFGGIGQALSIRDYRIYWTGQVVSVQGVWMNRVASGVLMYHITQSSAWLGAVAFLYFIPLFLVGPLAGQNRTLTGVQASFYTPAQTIVGARIKVTPALTLNGQAVRYNWSKFDAIRLDITRARIAGTSRRRMCSRLPAPSRGAGRWSNSTSKAIPVPTGSRYQWDDKSTYVRNPPYFDGMTMTPAAVGEIRGAYALALLGDSVTTDHISPAGNIAADSPGGKFLRSYWQPIAASEEMPIGGDPLPIRIMSENLTLYRGASGRA